MPLTTTMASQKPHHYARPYRVARMERSDIPVLPCCARSGFSRPFDLNQCASPRGDLEINGSCTLTLARDGPPSATDVIQTAWTSPLSALAAGVGDCKQYAVLKYAVLEDAGFAPDDLRLVVVRVKSLRNNHAVVAVRHAGQWFILDNRTLAVVESRKLLDYYQPLFMQDDRNGRQFVLPSGPKVAGLLQ